MAQFTNTRARYGLIAQVLHWLVALGILTLLASGIVGERLPEDSSAAVANKVWLLSWHKTLGTTILVLALLRIVWAFANPRPNPLHPEKRLETFAAETIHYALYVAIIAMPITGWLLHSASPALAPVHWPPGMDLGQQIGFVPQSKAAANVFHTLHFIFGATIVLCLIAHVGGAMKHLVIDRDATLARMLPGVTSALPLSLGRAIHKAGFGNKLVGALLAVFAVGGIGYGLTVGGTAANSSADPSRAASASQASEDNVATNASGAWVVDHSQSTLSITVDQFGGTVKGDFANWTADITFEKDALDQASAAVEITIGSLTLGSLTDNALSPNFLDTAQFPSARFNTTAFRALGDDRYEADATLTIQEKSVPVTLPFTLVIEGEKATMQGALEINRLDWGIGAEGFADEGSVNHAVTVNVEILANR